jgi:hypothetical protein
MRGRSDRFRAMTYKGHGIETWTPSPRYYEGRVADGPTEGQHNLEHAYKRLDVIAKLKASVDAATTPKQGA